MNAHDDEFLGRLIDEDALETYLEAHLGPADELEVERHAGGQSNETLFVRRDGTEYVLRRPPPGETAEGAHEVLREYAVMDALQETPVPVPRTVLACEDTDVIGAEWYLMEAEEGIVIRDEEPEQFAEPDHRRRLSERLVETLAEIHTLDYESVGLGEFGYPEGFTERQVDRWEAQFDWAFEVTAADRPIPGVDDVTAWLRENVPEDHPETLVHGDYKLDNVMFGTELPPEIRAVLDWEMSTLGDPFTDLGWMLAFCPESTAETDIIGAPGGYEFQLQEGYPTRDELVEDYESRSGFAFENERFYRALGAYKLAAVSEMFYRRYLEGSADNEQYPLMEQRTPTLVDWASRIIDGEELR